MHQSRVSDAVALIAALIVPLAVGGIGGIVTAGAIPAWFDALEKPAWTPPGWVFGPAWTILYVSMGVASWLVWRQGWNRPLVRIALAVYAVHLAFNLLWSIVFFGLRSPGWALGEIVILWALVVVTVALFYRVRPVAGLIVVPYLLWTSFAVALNGTIWWLNR